MEEKEMLLDLRKRLRDALQDLEDMIILSDPHSDDEIFRFLITKAANFRDTLAKIDQRLNEL
nr:hypothetical protein [uncultured Arsenicibacter sp.]